MRRRYDTGRGVATPHRRLTSCEITPSWARVRRVDSRFRRLYANTRPDSVAVGQRVRLAVSVYLVIATACGPAVCCCAPARASTALNRIFSGERRLGHDADSPACCGTSRLPTGPAHTPSEPAKPCPCQEQGGPHKDAVQSTEARVDFSASKHSGESAAVFSAFETIVSAGLLALPITTLRHSLGTSACPRAPHVLRC